MCIINDLNELMEDIHKRFYDINYGGCGAMAAIIGNVLQDRYEIRVAISPSSMSSNNLGALTFDDIREQVRDNCDNEGINNWHAYGVGFGHLWVEFKYRNKWYAIDSGNCVPHKKFEGYRKKYNEYMTLEDVNILGDNADGWNREFDRSQLPKIKKIVIRETKLILN